MTKKFYIEFDTIEELITTYQKVMRTKQNPLLNGIFKNLIHEAPEPSIWTKQSPCNKPNHSDEFNC